MNYSKTCIFLAALVSIMLAPIGFASAQIVAFGHSAVQGPVRENEMWPEVLEGILRARGSQVHVINAGIYGETTAQGLARIDSAVPEGAKIVILLHSGGNDARAISGSADPATNIQAMKSKMRARGIKVIDAWGLYRSVLREHGMRQVNGHLTVAGNKRLAEILAGTF